MTKKQRDLPAGCDFPYNIGNPATQALLVAGYTNMAQLTQATEKELLALHGVGRVAIDRLRVAMAEKGLSFAQE